MNTSTYAARVGLAAVALGIGLVTGGAGVAAASPSDDSSTSTDTADSAGPARSSSTGTASRAGRTGRGTPVRETADAPTVDRSDDLGTPLAVPESPANESQPEPALSRAAQPAPTAPTAPQSGSDPITATPSDLTIRVIPSPAAATPAATALDVSIAAPTTTAVSVPQAAASTVPQMISPALSAALAPAAAPPVMLAALAQPAPVVDLVASIAARLLGTAPESPLGWGMLAAVRGEIARYRRGAQQFASTVAPAATAASVPTVGGAATPPPFAANEVLVGWKPDATPAGRQQAMSAVKATVMERLGTKQMLQTDQGVVYRMLVPGGTSAAIAALEKNPAVAFVEPNYKVSVGATANDPSYTNGSLWGMSSDDSPTAYGPAGTTNQYGCGAEDAWGQGVTGSRDVVVAVIDEGIQTNHPDLAANIWVNPGEVAGDGLDNDGNGYVDDVNGWDFYHRDNTVYDVGEDAHGTHVAGTIGAVGGNGTGVSGVCWNTRIISAKFLGPQGGYISDAVSALNYLVDLKTRENVNLVAVNNSWGGGGYSSAMHGAINRAAKADILFVAAAGNATSDNDATASYPSNYSSLQAAAGESAASYESVVAVASITSTGGLSSFSNYGASSVDIGAPGSGILSTVPTDTYANYNGTSMATPHVTGALALYKSANPTATAATVRNTILSNAKPTTSLAGKTVTGGRLSLEGLFTGTTPTPVATYDPTVAAISTPLTVGTNRNSNVSITVGNLGNTAAQVNVALKASGGYTGPATTLSVPAGGTATTVIAWKTPKTRGPYTLTATAKLAQTGLVDADPSNNSKSVTVTVS
jgi:subtilisin family serine protease